MGRSETANRKVSPFLPLHPPRSSPLVRRLPRSHPIWSPATLPHVALRQRQSPPRMDQASAPRPLLQQAPAPNPAHYRSSPLAVARGTLYRSHAGTERRPPRGTTATWRLLLAATIMVETWRAGSPRRPTSSNIMHESNGESIPD